MTYRTWLTIAGGSVIGALGVALLLWFWPSDQCRVSFDSQGNAHISHRGKEPCHMTRKQYESISDHATAKGTWVYYDDGGIIQVDTEPRP